MYKNKKSAGEKVKTVALVLFIIEIITFGILGIYVANNIHEALSAKDNYNAAIEYIAGIGTFAGGVFGAWITHVLLDAFGELVVTNSILVDRLTKEDNKTGNG